MRVVLIHNAYAAFSGEEAVVDEQTSLLRRYGHDVIAHRRGGDDLTARPLGRLRACATGVISPASRREIRQLLSQHAPDVVSFHNLFPLISPYILPEFSRQNVPAVMTVHNYRLICPTGLHMSRRTFHVCDRCCGGKEYWCILKNCEGSFSKSTGYALRNWVARRFHLFLNHVAMYACLTQFQRQRLIDAGFSADRIAVVPNMVHDNCPDPRSNQVGAYVGYVGRISPEKGLDRLLEAAKELPGIPFQIAGRHGNALRQSGSLPENFRVLGFLDRKVIPEFISGARFMVLCSEWFEGCPIATLEAMVMARAVVAPRIGGIPEIVEDHVTGLLFEPGNVEDLAEKIQYLWDHPGLCKQLGLAGRRKALQEYSPERYYERLMAVYAKAIELGPPCAGTDRVRCSRAQEDGPARQTR